MLQAVFISFKQHSLRRSVQIEDVDICFTRNPHKPRLLCTRVIYANAFDIHLYKSQTDQETNKVHENSVENELIAVADNNLKLGICLQ